MSQKTKSSRRSTASKGKTAAKTSTVKPIPAGMHTVSPHLVCAGAAKAIAFYKKAFGAVEAVRVPGGGAGKLLHAALRIGDSTVMLTDEFPQMGALSPQTLKGTPVTIHLFFENVDRAFARVVKAGAEVVMPLQDMFWGDRYGVIRDPFGHCWSLAMHVRDVSPAEIRAAALAGCA